MDVQRAEKTLLEEERKLDEYLREERGVVRLCARTIKEVHRGNLEEALTLAKEAKAGMEGLPKIEGRGRHVEQEYAEALALISVATGKEVPNQGEMGVSAQGYLLGLADAVGEIKRLIIEELRKGEVASAQAHFARMEEIYGEIGHLHFSSAALPEFRRKQDVARMQIEDARGKLVR